MIFWYENVISVVLHNKLIHNYCKKHKNERWALGSPLLFGRIKGGAEGQSLKLW